MNAVNASSSSLLGEAHAAHVAVTHSGRSRSVAEECSSCCKAFASSKYARDEEVKTKFWQTQGFKKSQSKAPATAKVVIDHGKGAVKVQLLNWATGSFSPSVGDRVAARVHADGKPDAQFYAQFSSAPAVLCMFVQRDLLRVGARM